MKKLIILVTLAVLILTGCRIESSKAMNYNRYERELISTYGEGKYSITSFNNEKGYWSCTYTLNKYSQIPSSVEDGRLAASSIEFTLNKYVSDEELVVAERQRSMEVYRKLSTYLNAKLIDVSKGDNELTLRYIESIKIDDIFRDCSYAKSHGFEEYKLHYEEYKVDESGRYKLISEGDI